MSWPCAVPFQSWGSKLRTLPLATSGNPISTSEPPISPPPCTLHSTPQGLRSYENHTKLLAPWRDEWVDVLQGQLSGLFTGLLSALLGQGKLDYDGSDLMRTALEGSGGGGGSAWVSDNETHTQRLTMKLIPHE